MNVHGPVDGMEDGVDILASVFLSLQDILELPVSPVQVVLKDCDGKDVVQVPGRCV